MSAPQAPSAEQLPELKPWASADAALAWSLARDGRELRVRAFGREMRCSAFVRSPQPDGSSDGAEQAAEEGKGGGLGLGARLWGALGVAARPRAPLTGGDPNNLLVGGGAVRLWPLMKPLPPPCAVCPLLRYTLPPILCKVSAARVARLACHLLHARVVSRRRR